MILTSDGNLSLPWGAFIRNCPAGAYYEVLRGTMADNDFYRILAGGTSNNGSLEIATADDGTEPIYVRQYFGQFTSVIRTLTLLGSDGDTVIPGVLNYGSWGVPTTNFATQFRQDAFGNANNGQKIRVIRSDTANSNFFTYSSGLAWSTGDTHGYINPNYSTPDVLVGGGNANNLNWTAKLYHTGNFTRGTSYPVGGGDGWKYSQYI